VERGNINFTYGNLEPPSSAPKNLHELKINDPEWRTMEEGRKRAIEEYGLAMKNNYLQNVNIILINKFIKRV
jgi:hypothetical protein